MSSNSVFPQEIEMVPVLKNEMASGIPFREAHFFGLPSQSNVYGMKKLCTSDNGSKILVASLKNPVIFTLDFTKSSRRLIPIAKEVHFTYIPSGADIISIDAFNKSERGNDFVIGITFIKAIDNQNYNQYLNIYFDWEPGPEFNLESIAQSCTSAALSFVPYQLYHTKMFDGPHQETVWLLSGSDEQIHLYKENKLMHKFMEQPVGEVFPELDNIPSIVTWMDIVYFDSNEKRLTAIGCEDGYIRLSHVKTETKEAIATWDICHDGPITFVQLFHPVSTVEPPQLLKSFITPKEKQDEDFHLLATNSLEPSVVYRNVIAEGLENQLILPESERFDCVTCGCIADVDMDGENEIILGTYGQEILAYKYSCLKKSTSAPSSPTTKTPEDDGGYQLLWQKSFANPLHSIIYMDIMNDGVCELIALSLKGLHVMQYSPESVAELCLKNLKHLVERKKKANK